MKQKKALDNYVENHGNASKAMRDAGYSDASAKNPKNLTESKGFKQLAAEKLSDDFLIDALNADIASKEGNRKPELELAFKIRGKLVEKREIKASIEVSKEHEEEAGNAITNYLNGNTGDTTK